MKIGFIIQYLILILISIMISIFTINFYSSLEDKKIVLYYLSIINICFTTLCCITLLFDSYIKYGLFMTYISGCITMLLIYNIIYLNKEIQNYNNDKFCIIIAIIPIYTILWYNIISSGSYYIKYKELTIYINTRIKNIFQDNILKFHNFKYKNANDNATKIYNLIKNNEANAHNSKEILKKLLFLNN